MSERSLRAFAFGCVLPLAVLLAMGAISWRFFYRFYRVPTGAMAPTVPPGSYVLASRGVDEIERGHLITFRYPLDRRVPFIKRVVGLPGETLEIRDKQVFIDGKRLHEPYVHHEDEQIIPRRDALPEPYRSRDQFGPITVQPDHYFMMGDNRDRAHDSRYLGTVPRADITGRAVLVMSGAGWRRP